MSRLLLVLYWLALAAATHYPTVQIPGTFEWRDKVVHALTFGVLAFLFWRAITRTRPPRGTTAWLALLVLGTYAAVDEYTQQFVGRHTDFADWTANMSGIVMVLAVAELRRRLAISPASRASRS